MTSISMPSFDASCAMDNSLSVLNSKYVASQLLMITQSRQQFVLDLSRQEVVDCIYEQVAKVLRSANIAAGIFVTSSSYPKVPASATMPRVSKGVTRPTV